MHRRQRMHGFVLGAFLVLLFLLLSKFFSESVNVIKIELASFLLRSCDPKMMLCLVNGLLPFKTHVVLILLMILTSVTVWLWHHLAIVICTVVVSV